LSGVQFDTCNPFALSFSFINSIIHHSTFYQLKIHKTLFKDTDLTGTDFTATDLTDAVFDYCNLSQAIFDGTNLQKANFKTAYHFLIDPTRNKLNKAKFSVEGLPGLLACYDIVIE